MRLAEWMANNPASICTCGHTGDGPNGQHKGTQIMDCEVPNGHGSCKECECERFQWAGWVDGVMAEPGVECVWCGKPATEFRDDLSRKEYTISGLCQYCQDEAFREPDNTRQEVINDQRL